MHTCLVVFLKERMMQSCRLSSKPSVFGDGNIAVPTVNFGGCIPHG